MKTRLLVLMLSVAVTGCGLEPGEERGAASNPDERATTTDALTIYKTYTQTFGCTVGQPVTTSSADAICRQQFGAEGGRWIFVGGCKDGLSKKTISCRWRT
jgi:hypothetical protein